MPPIDATGITWIIGLTIGAILWMIFISPHLISRLAARLHERKSDQPTPLTFVDKITLYMTSIAMFITGFIVLIMFYEVIMRYFFLKPTLWVEELSRWLGGIVFLLAGIYAMQQRGHIRVVLLYDYVSRPVQRVFDLIATFCVVTFCAAVAIGYWKLALTKLQTWELYGSAWNPPIPAVMKPLICIVVVMMAIQTINNLIVDWPRDKAPPHDPADDII